MKIKIIYFIYAIIIFVVLGIYVHYNSDTKEITKEDTEYPALPVHELFVPIHADTLDLYLKQYFDRGDLKTKRRRNQYAIEYNPHAFILLHANSNNMKETRALYETASIDGFSIKYSKGKVEVVMKKEGDYVNCPSIIVAEILRKFSGQ